MVLLIFQIPAGPSPTQMPQPNMQPNGSVVTRPRVLFPATPPALRPRKFTTVQKQKRTDPPPATTDSGC